MLCIRKSSYSTDNNKTINNMIEVVNGFNNTFEKVGPKLVQYMPLMSSGLLILLTIKILVTAMEVI